MTVVKFGGMGIGKPGMETGAAVLKSDLAIVVKLTCVCYSLTWGQHGTHMRMFTGVYFCGRNLDTGVEKCGGHSPRVEGSS